MAKLIDLFNKLKNDYNERQKKIDNILDNTNKAMESHAEAMEAMKKFMENLDITLIKLQKDYDYYRKRTDESISNIKKNPWLRLFGVK